MSHVYYFISVLSYLLKNRLKGPPVGKDAKKAKKPNTDVLFGPDDVALKAYQEWEESRDAGEDDDKYGFAKASGRS